MRGNPEINWEGIFQIEKDKFSLEGTFRLNKSVDMLVGILSFKINDIVHGNNHDILLFSGELVYNPLCNSRIMIPNIYRDIFYLKFNTGINSEEERFLRDFNRMNAITKQKYMQRFNEIQQRISQHIVEEKERIMHILNDEKWHGGALDLF